MMPSGTRRIILQAPDSSIAVDVPVQRVVDDPAEFAAHVSRLEASGFTVLNDDATGADLPNEQAGQSRKFRNCWRWTGTAVATDVPLARAQLMAEMRTERNSRLEESDGKQLRANETGTEQQKTDWNTYRQSLRDLPVSEQTAVDALASAADLETHAVTWPTEPT